MLIVFDLDDTLIDTLGSITPFKLKKAVDKMIFHGLKIKNKEGEVNSLLAYDQNSPSCEKSLENFLENYEDKKKYLTIALEAVYKDFDPQIKVIPHRNAPLILANLRKDHKLALVTIGEEKVQYLKLKKAGIDCSLFSMIDVIPNDKGSSYKKIINTLGVSSQDTWVCGDKLSTDLKPAKELGCTTVLMKKGRGKNIICDHSFADYEIEELEELKKIIGEGYGDK